MLKISSPVVSPNHVDVVSTTTTTLSPSNDLSLSPSPTSKKNHDLKKMNPLEINTKSKKLSLGGSLSASLELTPKKIRESSGSSVLTPKSKSPNGHQKSSSFSSFTSSMSKLISTVTPTSPIKHKRSRSAIAIGGALSSASTTSSPSSHLEFKLKSHHHHHHIHSRSNSGSAIKRLNHVGAPSTKKNGHARSASTASGKSFSISSSSTTTTTTASTSSASTPIKKTQSRNLSTSSASTSGSSPMSPYSPNSSLFTSSEDDRSSPASSLNEVTTCDNIDSPSPTSTISLHPESEYESDSESVSDTEPEYESKPLFLSSEVKSIVDNLPEGLTHSMSKFDGKQYPEFWHLTQEDCRTLTQWNELEFKKQGKIFEFFLLLKRIRFNTKRMVNHYGPGLLNGSGSGGGWNGNGKLSSKHLKACKLAFDSLSDFNADLKKLVVFQLKPCYDYTFFVNDYQVLKIALSWFGELAGSCPASSALTFKSKSSSYESPSSSPTSPPQSPFKSASTSSSTSTTKPASKPSKLKPTKTSTKLSKLSKPKTNFTALLNSMYYLSQLSSSNPQFRNTIKALAQTDKLAQHNLYAANAQELFSSYFLRSLTSLALLVGELKKIYAKSGKDTGEGDDGDQVLFGLACQLCDCLGLLNRTSDLIADGDGTTSGSLGRGKGKKKGKKLQ
ncbi:unnamed protein product [Ambrosiozyma monospora]|uniref:Unnamed protein product n=1 Tax=Ambrosiozyma monospora TaxID=43982 RepID=A0A9W6Z6N8_AMBMO|nr:unnamed protein product [Ambrosiozyma monospora]